MSTSIAIGLLVFAIFVLPKMIVVVPEGTVLMTFAVGKFKRAYASGLHVGWFDLSDKIKLKLGTIGTTTSESTFEVQGYQISASFAERAEVGSSVRVSRFEGTRPFVTRDGVPASKPIVCEKCGHQMSVGV